MIAVLFEAWPAEGRQDHYLDLAASLRPQLDSIEGFISIERFQSLADAGKLLSLSFWRDEKAVKAWRNTPAHRATQAQGRSEVFSDYRLRIADLIRDYGKIDRAAAPQDSQAAHREG